MNSGRCELCHANRSLCLSHYLPRATYKNSRLSGLTNENPIVVSGGKAKQTSVQVQDHKFCEECEARFNENGEKWVLAHMYRPGQNSFPIHEVLNGSKPKLIDKDFFMFSEEDVPGINLDKLVYFGMSVFWRGTLRWRPLLDARLQKVYLGRCENRIRSYLLGRGTLPPDLFITVAIWPFKEILPVSLFPELSKGEVFRRYWFYLFGFIFVLGLGRNIPDLVKRACAYKSRVVTVSASLGESVRDIFKYKSAQVDQSSIKGTLEEIQAIRNR
jgi:hypothetical protein